VNLLMANGNSTDDGTPVVLTLPNAHRDFLYRTVAVFKKGADKDLRGKLTDAQRNRCKRESAAYGRLLRGLKARRIVPDPDVIEVAAKMAEVIDAGIDFQKAMLEHRATCRLLALLEEGSGR
jgi:hypothetical protein